MEHWHQKEIVEHSVTIMNSYQRITGIALFDISYPDEYKSYLLYHAPFVVLSHGTQADPVFNYANLTAQQLWHLDWTEFIQLPSRLSAEPDLQEDREHLLAEAAQKGFIDNYRGIRKATNGKRFRIENVLLWNLMDEEQNIGQAALFRNWTNL